MERPNRIGMVICSFDNTLEFKPINWGDETEHQRVRTIKTFYADSIHNENMNTFLEEIFETYPKCQFDVVAQEHLPLEVVNNVKRDFVLQHYSRLPWTHFAFPSDKETKIKLYNLLSRMAHVPASEVVVIDSDTESIESANDAGYVAIDAVGIVAGVIHANDVIQSGTLKLSME